MTVEIALVFAIVLGALVLFASQKLPLDVTALVILVTVMAIPQLFHGPWLLSHGVDLQAAFPTIGEGLSGLSNPATVTVLAMFILSAGVQRTGLVHVVARRTFGFVGNSELRQLMVIALIIGPVSGLVNNTAAVAVAIPLVLDMARSGGTRASRLLIPLSFFGMMGGTLTLIGTSTNILASSLLRDVEAFGREIHMFEFTHVGVVVLLVGVAYFATIGRWLLPADGARRLDLHEQAPFVVEVAVPEGSGLVDSTLEDSGFAQRHDVEVLRLVRDGRSIIKNAATTELAAGDILQLHADMRVVSDLIGDDDVQVMSDFGSDQRVRDDGRLVRILLRNRDVFAGRPGRAIDFWARYRARPVGIEIDDPSSARVADHRLDVGEVLLLQLSTTSLRRLERNLDVVVLEKFADDFDRGKMSLAAGIVIAVVVGAVATPLPIVVTALMGVVAMVATGCVGKDDIYSGVAWDVIIMLAGVIPLGIAMSKSGAADWLAARFVDLAGGWHPLLVLMALYVLTTLMTELVSNNASVVILVPVAIALSSGLQIELFALVLAVMFAASTSFLSPVGYQTNTMIYGTGLYRFGDFAKVGAPLNVLLMVVTCTMIWLLWVVR